MRYLKNTFHYKLTYNQYSIIKIHGYSHADLGSNKKHRKSIIGYVFKITENSSPTSWKSKKQQSTALSSYEAEYFALTEASKEAAFLRNLCEEMKFYISNNTEIALVEKIEPCIIHI